MLRDTKNNMYSNARHSRALCAEKNRRLVVQSVTAV